MIFTTSYKIKGMNELLAFLPMVVNAKKIIEFGTQQGHSAIWLARSGAKVYTYDSFSLAYEEPPFKPTHANYEMACKNTQKYGDRIVVRKANVFKLKPTSCDVLHIDLCNHYGNVLPLLEGWTPVVKKMIILEGGVYNKWQKKYGFKPFIEVLDLFPSWGSVVLGGEGGYAMTVMVKI